MSRPCWMCEKDTGFKATDYGDHRCPHCNVEISILDPKHPDWLPEIEPETTETEWLNEKEAQQKEKKMFNYDDPKYQGKYVYLPKIGEEAVFEIKEIREVKSDNEKFNFSENVPVIVNGEQVLDDDGEPVFKKKDLGYHIEAELQDGKILSVTNLGTFFVVFKKHNIQDGEQVKIEHPEKGVWRVTKL